MKTFWTIIALATLAGSPAFAAGEEQVSGVVTSVSTDRQTITIRNERSGRRNTYFIGSQTRFSSEGGMISLADIKPGNEVTLMFKDTDQGREIVSMNVPNARDIKEIIPVDVTEIELISGVVTGVRPIARTVTIREDGTKEKRTITIPEETPITRDGKTLAIRSIKKGDEITARFRNTEQGLVLVTGRSPVAAPAPAAAPVAPRVAAAPAPMMELPKTATNVFAYLLAGLVLFAGAAAIRVARIRAAK